jgi:hypothetical protein
MPLTLKPVTSAPAGMVAMRVSDFSPASATPALRLKAVKIVPHNMRDASFIIFLPIEFIYQ